MNFTMNDSNPNFTLYNETNPFIMFVVPVVHFIMITGLVAEKQVYSMAKKVYSKLLGVERFNRNNTQIYRELTEYEYGKKITSGFHQEITQNGIFNEDSLNGLGYMIDDTRNFYKYYKGIFKNNKLNGVGEFNMYDKSADHIVCYTGMFYKNALHGDCRVTSDYFTLEGKFSYGMFLSGKITITKFDKNVMSERYKYINYITGNFGKYSEYMYETTILPFFDLNGHGEILYSNGVWLSGGFLDGDLSGYGETKFKTHTEAGMYKDGCLNGSGQFIFDTFTVSADEIKEGEIISKYDVHLENDIEMHHNLITNTFEITFTNGDKCTFTPDTDINFEQDEHCFMDLYEELFYEDISNVSYKIADSLESLEKTQFMYWLFATDKELYHMVCESNLYNFIDGKLFMSFDKPSDFDLPEINDNVLQKLLDYKNDIDSNPDGIVLVTTKII